MINERVIVMVVCISFFFMSLWTLDISVSALLNDSKVTNALFNLEPVVTYHLALCSTIFFFLVGITYFLMSKNRYKSKNNR